MATRLDWVKGYYSRAGEYWTGYDDNSRNLSRVAIVERLCGPAPLQILELGAGHGATTFALAEAGYDVVSVDFAPLQAAVARSAATQIQRGSMKVLEDDFYQVQLDQKFDLVCYWDGFGVGSDNDQRRLLKRIANDWLAPGGCALIDVFSPFRWIREAGREIQLSRNHPTHQYAQRRRFGYDPVRSCFVDQWCPIDDETGHGREEMAITQTIRCYSPADFQLLLEGTGLRLAYAEVGGELFQVEEPSREGHRLWDSWDFLVRLEAV